MTITNQNFKVFRGNSYTLHVDLTQADGTPFDPSLNASIRWRLATSPYIVDDQALILKSLNNGIAVVGNSGVDITLTPADTDITPDLYYHELKVWDGPDAATVMTGNARIRPAVRMGDNITVTAGSLTISSVHPTRTP